MASQEFTVLYTHQKMKKSKTWQDGVLRIRPGENKAILFDEKGQYLESMFIKSQVNSGDNLESERYLITVEEAKMKENSCENQPRKAEVVDVNRRGVKPGVLPPRHLSVGLKRKFKGFQGPRQVEKKVSTVEDGERMAVLPTSEHSRDLFPSRFYSTSPLFSTVYKKNAETDLSTGLREDGGTDNRDRVTPSPVVSLPFLHTCNETEKKNSDQSMVKPESPLITGHTKSSSWTAGHGAVSQNIRSTAQIIALLKSKTTQVCREQATSEVTKCSRFQALENRDSSYSLKSTTLPAFSVNSDKSIAQNIHHLPSTKEMVNDKKEWNIEMLINSSEPCDKEITGRTHDKKADSLSQDLQDPCKTNSSVLSELTISRVSDSQFVSSCSASPIAFEAPVSISREHLAINGLQDNSSIDSQRDLQLRQSSERAPSDSELSEDVTVTENGIALQGLSPCGRDCSPDKQVMEVNFDLLGAFDFPDVDNGEHCERNKKELTEEDMLSKSVDCLEGEDGAQNTALRLNSCFEVMTHCKKEENKCSIYDVENDGNRCTENMPLQFCNNVVGTESVMEDSTEIVAELLDDRNSFKEINESLISIETVNNKKDLDVCAALTINGTLGTKRKHFDLSPGDTNVECHPKTGMFCKTENVSCLASSSIISTTEGQTEDDIMQLGCRKSPDGDIEHFWGTKSDYIKPNSPVLTLSQNSESCCGSFQNITEGHQNVSGFLSKEDTLISRSAICPLGKGHSASEETEMGETEFENPLSVNVPHGACKGERIEMDCLKFMAMAENSSDLPALVNNITLLRALSQCSTALDSLQMMKENNDVLHEAETSKEILKPLIKDEAIKRFTEMPYSESIQASSCSCVDSSGNLKTELCVPLKVLGQRDPRASDCQWKPVEFQGYQIKGSASSETMLRVPCSQLGWQQNPDTMEFAAERFLSPPFSSNYVLSDFRESPDSTSLHEDNTNFIREENFQKKFNIRDSVVDHSPLALNPCSEVPPWIVSSSPSHSVLGEMQWTSWEPDKIISSVQLNSSVSPASGKKESVQDTQEPLVHRNLPSDSELSEDIFSKRL